MIHKNHFDAALTPNFRTLVSKIYAEMLPIQEAIAGELKLELSNELVWQIRNCPICGETARPKEESLEYPYGMNITCCHCCGFTYSADVLNQEHDSQLYEATERFYEIYLRLKNQPVYRELEQTKAKYIVQTAESFIKKGKMLDIGSGAGSVVLAAQESGWDATGIEPNPLFFQESRNKGLNVVQGFFPILANSKQQTANSKQQTANSKQQTANSKQQTAMILSQC